jgi:hypothetical protein
LLITDEHPDSTVISKTIDRTVFSITSFSRATLSRIDDAIFIDLPFFLIYTGYRALPFKIPKSWKPEKLTPAVKKAAYSPFSVIQNHRSSDFRLDHSEPPQRFP